MTGLWTMLFLAGVTAVFLLLTPELVGLFTSEPGALAIGIEALRTLSYGYVFYAWGMATIQGFNGAGDTWTPTWMHLACFWALEIPLAWSLAHRAGLGPQGVFWSVCLSESALAVLGVLLFRRGRWKTTRLAPDAPTPRTGSGAP
jgi:Na+-driven multidrug efflux pump